VSRNANRKMGEPSGHPSPSVTKSHKIRKDEMADKRLLTAFLLFGGVMLGLVAAGTWTVLSSGGQGGEVSGGQAIALIVLLLGAFASVVNVFVAYGKVRWFYRCPSCGKRLPRPPKKLGPIQYPCDTCGVLWDTGCEWGGPGY
jgi:hypothetical protein